MMKYYFTILFFLALSTPVKATFCIDRIYQEEKIKLYLCQNHSGFNETRGLLYKARTKILNTYIKEKIVKGELKDKIFHIEIHDECTTSPTLMLYDESSTPSTLILEREKEGYFVTITGYPSLQRLLAIVDYFSKPDWEPFLAADFDEESIENIEKRIEEFYVQNTKNEVFSYKPFSVWRKDEVRLQYLGDSLRYIINNKPLSFQMNSSLPVKIQGRYLFFQFDRIFVVQDAKTIESIEIDTSMKDTDEDFDIYVFPKWVNICWGGKDNWMYSYSYERNKFYENKR